MASRKITLLLKCGAKICVIAPRLCTTLKALLEKGRNLEHIDATYSPELLDSLAPATRLVLAATSDKAINLQIASHAKALNIACNVADNPDAGTFILPSVVERDPILIAISSGGTSPILSRLIRDRVEAFIPKSYSRLALLAGEFRNTVKAKLGSIGERKHFWEKTLHGRVAELVLSGQSDKARTALIESLDAMPGANATNSNTANTTIGEVSLVGAGPGDPDLLTLRALRLIQSADVLVYDRLVSERIMDLRRHDAKLMYAGKAKSDHAMPQGSINDLLVSLAREGHRVVRLKGGDPFIFGRGGEEIETLAKHKIPFQVVPGITAASGCSAFAGIPLTHRDHAQSCVFLTGHLKNGEINLQWNHLRDPTQTIVIYMGLTGLNQICENLIRVGRSVDTPVALVEQGTTPSQRVHVGTLETITGLVTERKVRAPTLLIVGSVVTLHESLSWFQSGVDDHRKASHFSNTHPSGESIDVTTRSGNDALNKPAAN